MKGWHDRLGECFTLRPACSQERLLPGSGRGWAKVQGLEEGEELNQSLVNKYFVSKDQWG